MQNSYNQIAELEQLFQSLPAKNINLFSAACSERLIDLYDAFSIKENWGDFSKVRSSLDLVWTFLINQSVTDYNLKESQEVLLQLSPHSDDFSSPEVVLAQLSSGTLYTTIQNCLSGNSSNDFNPDLLIGWIFSNFKTVICYDQTGYWQLGNTIEAKEFESKFVNDLRVSNGVIN